MRYLRWALFLGAWTFLIRAVFFESSVRAIAGFLVCGVLWYFIGRRKLHSLDGRWKD